MTGGQMQINIKYVPSVYKVKLWWTSAIFPGVNGIAEWEPYTQPWEVGPDSELPINDLPDTPLPELF